MFLRILSVLLVAFFVFLGKNAQAQKKVADLDTLAQSDSFRTITWMADSFSKAIMKKKINGLMSLFPKYGTYLKYSKQVAPEMSNGTRSARYGYFKAKLIKKQKKLRKQMKREGISFSRAEIQKVKVDSAKNEDSIGYCKVRVYYKKKKNKFIVECHGIKIKDQWFLLDGFLFDRRD